MTSRPLTTAEAAEALRCHEKTVRRMIGRGELRATLVAGRYLIAPEDLPTAAPPRPAPPRRRPGPPRGVASAAVREIEAAS